MEFSHRFCEAKMTKPKGLYVKKKKKNVPHPLEGVVRLIEKKISIGLSDS